MSQVMAAFKAMHAVRATITLTDAATYMLANNGAHIQQCGSRTTLCLMGIGGMTPYEVKESKVGALCGRCVERARKRGLVVDPAPREDEAVSDREGEHDPEIGRWHDDGGQPHPEESAP